MKCIDNTLKRERYLVLKNRIRLHIRPKDTIKRPKDYMFIYGYIGEDSV